MFIERRRILIDKKDMVKALEILDNNKATWHGLTKLKLGCCNFEKAPDCWFIALSVSNKKWATILKTFVEKEVVLLPETTGY